MESNGSTSIFVGDQYLPGVTAEQVMALVARVRAAVDDLSREGAVVRLLSTTFVPQEEWLLDLFEASDTEAVHMAYARALVSVERIVDALHIPSAAPSTSGRIGQGCNPAGKEGR